MRKSPQILAITMFAGLLGCSFIARGPEQYRDDTRALLETKTAAIKECYDVQLAIDRNTGGTVVMNFTVEKKTGKIMNTAIDPARSTAPEQLRQCVVSSVDGLVLMPEDRRDGLAIFTWEFTPGPPSSVAGPAGGPPPA